MGTRQTHIDPIRVLILDNELVQREGIAKVVQDAPQMTVVRATGSAQEAVTLLRERPIDLALVDLVLGYGLSGINVGRDGVWGPETEGADELVREELGIGGLGTRANWLQFLDETAKRAFNIVIGRDLIG